MGLHLFLVMLDAAGVFSALLLALALLKSLPRERSAWLAAWILLNSAGFVLFQRSIFGAWIPEPYRLYLPDGVVLVLNLVIGALTPPLGMLVFTTARVGGVHVFFLDTDIPLNDPADRPITGLLYVRGREMRLAQEIVLGVGGVRAIRALGLKPAVWHMNEGHVAMLTLERVRERVLRGEEFAEACAAVRRNTVFTTHTPVPAGNEVFSKDLVKEHLEPWSRDTGVPADEVIALGSHEGMFNLTALSIRLSASTNGMSELRVQVASVMRRRLRWPDPARRAPEPSWAATS